MERDAATTYESRSCAVCRTVTPQEMTYEKWSYPIFRCSVCGLGSVGVGDGFNTASIYSEDYFQGGRKDGYADYLSSERPVREEFRRIVHKLRSFGPREGRLLEVGCAYGFFLLEAQQHFECFGVEISEPAAESCTSRGLKVLQGTVNSTFLREKGPFHVVVMLDVIEHLENPAETLSLLYDALNQGGSLVISTGDWDSLLARLMRKHWRLMTPPQHLFYFSRKTLTELLQKIGFRVVYCTRPWKRIPLGLIAYQLGNRIGWRLSFLESLNWLALPINLFDALQIIARKP